MTVAGVLIGNIKDGIPLWATRLEQGLASSAIGLVALAAYKMSTTLATDKLTRILALIAGGISVLYSSPWLLPVMMIAGGLVSYSFDAFLAPIYSQMIMRRRGKFANEKVHVAGATGESKDETCEQGDVDATLESERANNTVVDIDSDTDLATSDKVKILTAITPPH